jgi:hypothetical protein
LSESTDLPPTDSSAPRERFGNAGCVLGCFAQLVLFLFTYAVVYRIAPDRLAIVSPENPVLLLAAMVLWSWLVPLVFSVRLIRRDALPPARADQNTLLSWAVVSAVVAGAAFLLMNVRV